MIGEDGRTYAAKLTGECPILDDEQTGLPYETTLFSNDVKVVLPQHFSCAGVSRRGEGFVGCKHLEGIRGDPLNGMCPAFQDQMWMAEQNTSE
jgi:hypothetical protein